MAVKVKIEGNAETLARWTVATLNKCGGLSLELVKNDAWRFDLIIWEKDGEHAKSYTNIDLNKLFDILDVIGATLKAIK